MFKGWALRSWRQLCAHGRGWEIGGRLTASLEDLPHVSIYGALPWGHLVFPVKKKKKKKKLRSDSVVRPKPAHVPLSRVQG